MVSLGKLVGEVRGQAFVLRGEFSDLLVSLFNGLLQCMAKKSLLPDLPLMQHSLLLEPLLELATRCPELVDDLGLAVDHLLHLADLLDVSLPVLGLLLIAEQWLCVLARSIERPGVGLDLLDRVGKSDVLDLEVASPMADGEDRHH